MMRLPRFAMSLKFQILAGVMGLLIVFSVAVMGHIHGSLSGLLKDELRRRGSTVAGLLAHSAEESILTGDLFSVHESLRETMARFDDVRYAYVADRSGRVLAHSFPQGFPAGLYEAHASRGRGFSVQAINTEDGRVMDLSLPLLDGRLGWVHVGMKEYIVRHRIACLVMGWAASILALLLAGSLTAYWLTSRLTRRFSHLMEVAGRVGQGDFSVRAQPGLDDEMGRLAQAFNGMTADLKLVQDQLIRSGQLAAIGELASSVAHEINNPLNTMGVCTQALRERAAAPSLRSVPDFADFPEYLDTINSEIFRCKRITLDLLHFARQKPPVRRLVDINQVVRETAALLAPRVNLSRNSLDLDLAPGLPMLPADADQLKQVFLNLLINAFDHTPEGGAVGVATSAHNGSLQVLVRDTGCGIRAEHLPRLFQPFFTTKPHGNGTGLGLAICQRIVDSHQGRISASSRPGEGATFTVTLPAAGGQALG